MGTDGNFYGTTWQQGANNPYGETIFRIGTDGSFKSLYSFCAQANCVDGWEPFGGLVEGTDGNFYGTTSQGGNNVCSSGPVSFACVGFLSADLPAMHGKEIPGMKQERNDHTTANIRKKHDRALRLLGFDNWSAI